MLTKPSRCCNRVETEPQTSRPGARLSGRETIRAWLEEAEAGVPRFPSPTPFSFHVRHVGRVRAEGAHLTALTAVNCYLGAVGRAGRRSLRFF